jgi:shikimate kinase
MDAEPTGFPDGMKPPKHERATPVVPVRERLSRLVLTGFMGAGKSTVGVLLAESVGWRFFDLDTCIEAACSCSVAEIFRKHGESYFRRKEREILEQFQQEDQAVLALGGGTIEDPMVLDRLLLWEGTCLVFLDAPLPELLARIDPRSQTRPLLTAPEELSARHQRRLPLYRAAHLTVTTTGLAPRAVADQVLENVRKGWRVEQRGASSHGKSPKK